MAEYNFASRMFKKGITKTVIPHVVTALECALQYVYRVSGFMRYVLVALTTHPHQRLFRMRYGHHVSWRRNTHMIEKACLNVSLLYHDVYKKKKMSIDVAQCVAAQNTDKACPVQKKNMEIFIL